MNYDPKNLQDIHLSNKSKLIKITGQKWTQ